MADGFGRRRSSIPLLELSGTGLGMDSPVMAGLSTGNIGYLLNRRLSQQASSRPIPVTPTSPTQTLLYTSMALINTVGGVLAQLTLLD